VVVGQQVQKGGRELEGARSQHRHRLALARVPGGLLHDEEARRAPGVLCAKVARACLGVGLGLGLGLG